MSSVTQKLIARDIAQRRESRRGTVLTEPKLLNYDTAAIDRTVYVVDVDIGGNKPVRNVPVQSSSGLGGRAYARQGKGVEIRRNAGGRWLVVGASDRIKNTATVQLLDETTELATSGPSEGVTFGRRAFDFYSENLAWGVAGFGNDVILDAQDNEVF